MNGDIAIGAVVGIGLIAAMMSVLLRQYRPEFALLTALAATILIFTGMSQWLIPAAQRVRELLEQEPELAGSAAILLKAVGVCFITQLACDLCRDAGENAIAARVETAGKAAILLISLPLFEQVLELVMVLLR
ncbi:MAG: stage III sporulation protein AD [Oscillospiraceae bacterium]|jgi:stage III sporulation protein AD|nr:stage III sporulation protein AD [Oscillospiraceae bacterium]